MALSNTANEVDLTPPTAAFVPRRAVRRIRSETVNTDGWKATQAAWRTLFPRWS
jgi:hypothetical protein